MAGVRRSWARPLAAAALLFGAAVSAFAQSAPSGSLSGKLTDLHSVPLGGATIVLRNQQTGAEARTITAKNGAYSFAALEPGEYTLEADSPEQGRGRLEGVLVPAGHEARVQAAMAFAFAPAQPLKLVFHEIPTSMATIAEALPARPVLAMPLTGLSKLIDVPDPPATLLAELSARVEPLAWTPIRMAMLPTWDLARPAVAANNGTNSREGPEIRPSGAKAQVDQGVLAARLKSCPDTKPAQIAAGGGTLADCKSPTDSAGHMRGLKPPPPSELSTSAAYVPNQPASTHVTGQLAAVSPAMDLAGSGGAASAFAVYAVATGRGVALTEETARGMQAAIQAAIPHLDRIQAATEEPGPVGSAVTTTVTGADLQALPVSGRRWQDFVLDSPAAASPEGSGGPTLRGVGQGQADTTVDGMSTRLAFGSGTSTGSGTGSGSSGRASSGQATAGPDGMGQTWAGGRGFAVSESAIREVRTTAGNIDAQAARAAGGSVDIATNRGANGLHGQGFLFDRQNSWGARNPFTQWIKETAPATSTTIPVFTPQSFTPSDRETTWGVGMGSQIRRNKLFWFAALDGYRRNDPGVSTVKHPDMFFAQPSNDRMQLLGAQLGAGSNAVAKYSQLLESLDGLLGPAPRTADQWVGFARIDWAPTERHRFTLEGIGANWDSPGGGFTRVSETYGNRSFGSSHAGEQWLLARWEAFLTPNLLAVTQASAGRNILSTHAETPSTFEQTFNQNIWGQLPQIVVDSRYGFTIGNPARFGPGSYPDERLFRIQESVDWVHGNLLVKAGFDVSHNADVTGLLRNQTGTYYYSSVENFATDALAFGASGLSDALDLLNPHNCDQTGKAWHDSAGKLRGLGNLPCYSYHSQTMGPANWHLSANDWAGYATAQWQAGKLAVFSAGLRWEREQLPPPIALLANSDLPQTAKLPSLGNNWGPRLSVAIGGAERRWPVLRLGYGMYYARVQNATLETALTQTGSPNGDMNFFSRPTDNLNAGGAPPFPYVFACEPLSIVKPGAVEFASRFRNPEVHQAVAAIEQNLPSHIQLTASAMLSLGRRLPISIDTNLETPTAAQTITYAVVDGTGKGPIKATQITVPFYAMWPSATSGTCTAGRPYTNYQQIVQLTSRANSTYEAAMIRVNRYGRRGLSLHGRYTYAHAMDWNPNESSLVTGSDVLDPADFSREYGTSNLDVRHSASASVIYEAPWKLHNLAGRAFNGWMLSGIGQYRGGMPYTMRTSGSLPEEFNQTTGAAIAGLGTGMNGSGGDNRIYGVGNDKVVYNIGRNTFRYPAAWKADLRLGKRFDLGHLRQLELLAETFNLFNHQNVTELETVGYTIQSGTLTGGFPTLNFLAGIKANTTAFGQPLNINSTNFYRERQIQLGLRMRF